MAINLAMTGLILMVLIMPALAQPDNPAPDDRWLITIGAGEPALLDQLASRGLDVWEVNDKGVVVHAAAADRAWLTAQGMAWAADETRQAAIAEAVAAEQSRLAARSSSEIAGTLDYFTLAEYETAMQAWAAAHPDRVTSWTLTTTAEGRSVYMMRVSTNAAVDEDEPEVLLISLQHAREWLAGMTLWGVAGFFIEQYGVDARATAILDSTELYFILVCNPDGFHYTHTNDRYWRKNRRNNGDGSFGVDLNRNWPWEWATAPSTPSSTTYRGPSPLSEPENAAMEAWIAGRGDDLKGVLNYHTYGTRVMHNWAYKYEAAPNMDTMGPVARDMALAIEDVNGQRMRNGAWSVTLNYTGGGATIDHCHATLGVPTLTLELRPGDGQSGDFVVSNTHIEPSISENIEGAISFINWARGAGDDATSPVVSQAAVSKISNTQATISWTTDDAADRAVEFGPTPALGGEVQPDRLRGRRHSVTLTGLSPSTQYHARARSRNLAGLTGYSETLTFTTAASPQDITNPDGPFLEILRRAPNGRIFLQWQASASGDVAGYRLYESLDGTTWTIRLDEAALTAGMTSTAFDAPALDTTLLYRMTAVDGGADPNESFPSDTYAIRVGLWPARVLIVDGNDRWSTKPEASGLGPSQAFAADHGLAVGAYGVGFDTCANQMTGAGVELTDYEVVIWMLGDETTGGETFSAAEQALVIAYLEGGGNFFTSGSEIAWDLDRSSGPSATDRAFFNNYLSADYAQDDMDRYDATGAGGASAFGTRLIRFDEGSRGIYRVWTPDVVTPVNGGVAAVRELGGARVCGVQRAGMFGGGAAPAKMIYLAFPFETIFNAPEREAVMADALTWFGLAPDGTLDVKYFYLY